MLTVLPALHSHLGSINSTSYGNCCNPERYWLHNEFAYVEIANQGKHMGKVQSLNTKRELSDKIGMKNITKRNSGGLSIRHAQLIKPNTKYIHDKIKCSTSLIVTFVYLNKVSDSRFSYYIILAVGWVARIVLLILGWVWNLSTRFFTTYW